MEMKLQRSTTSFRRQGSSGVTWNDKFLSGDLNMMKLNNQGNRGPDVVMRRSGSDGSNGHMQRAVEAALPAFDPPSPKEYVLRIPSHLLGLNRLDRKGNDKRQFTLKSAYDLIRGEAAG
ncbi:hypothetical protein GQ457_12G023700 [Hibiscus cannabinus]